MRKTVFIALIISLVLGLIAGCGSMKQSAVTDATTISKQEQASKIDFIRKSIYDKAMSYIDEVMSDEKILEMKDILTTNNGDFGELYNMILLILIVLTGTGIQNWKLSILNPELLQSGSEKNNLI